jgi:hypothetical protein
MANGIEERDEHVIIGGVVLKKRQFRFDARVDPVPVPAPAAVAPRKLRVFISHASEDKVQARLIRKILLLLDMEPWLDEEEIDVGRRWKGVIEEAMTNADVALFCCSSRSIDKPGYLHEVGLALKRCSPESENPISVVPIRLEDCTPVGGLMDWQCADLHKQGGIDRLMAFLGVEAKRLGLAG